MQAMSFVEVLATLLILGVVLSVCVWAVRVWRGNREVFRDLRSGREIHFKPEHPTTEPADFPRPMGAARAITDAEIQGQVLHAAARALRRGEKVDLAAVASAAGLPDVDAVRAALRAGLWKQGPQ